jgi:hypothetical protein
VPCITLAFANDPVREVTPCRPDGGADHHEPCCAPASLESANPGDDHRCARAAFRPFGGLRAVRNDAGISPTWREVGDRG